MVDPTAAPVATPTAPKQVPWWQAAIVALGAMGAGAGGGSYASSSAMAADVKHLTARMAELRGDLQDLKRLATKAAERRWTREDHFRYAGAAKLELDKLESRIRALEMRAPK